MSGVSIIGIGLHPFGRTPERSGMEQAVVAAQAALRDLGITWQDVQYAFGGSSSAGSADTLVNKLGLTGLPFINVANGCATGGSALMSAVSAIRSGMADLAVAVGFDKHPRGAFNPKPADFGIGDWYGETGMMLTTQFFALKARRYMHEHGISEGTLVRVAQRAFRNGALNPNAWRRSEMSYEQIAQSPPVNLPLRKYMLCAPAEGGVALVLCAADRAPRYPSRSV